MSELDEQKAKVDWLKDLFKIYVAAIFAIAAGLLSLLNSGNINLLFYVGIASIVVIGILASLKAKEISQEIQKLRDLS